MRFIHPNEEKCAYCSYRNGGEIRLCGGLSLRPCPYCHAIHDALSHYGDRITFDYLGRKK